MAKQQSRKDEILDAASKLFARHGYKKTTLDEVAGEIGIVKSALYRYFANKEELFNAMIDRIAGEHMDAAEKAVQGTQGIEDKLRAHLLASYEATVVRVEKDLMPIEVWNELKPFVDDRTLDYKRSAIDFNKKIIDQGVESGVLRCRDSKMVAVLMQLFCEYLYDSVFRKEMNDEAAARHLGLLVDIIMDGLRNKNGEVK
jgi:AcrR family transcriptional regulator